VKGSATVGGPNGHRSNGSEIEGRRDPRLETRVPDGVPDRRARRDSSMADRMNACQIYGSKSWCRTRCQTGAGRGAKRDAQRGRTRGQTGGPTGARRDARRGARRGQTGPDGSHVIGYVIFECHVTRLGWQGVILLPTLLSQR
jgi:hypothetical protein